MSDDQNMAMDANTDTAAPAADANPADANAQPAQAGGADKFGRPLFKVACTKCGGEATVPFQPTPGRAVYCQNCYKPKPRRDFGGGGDRGGRSFSR